MRLGSSSVLSGWHWRRSVSGCRSGFASAIVTAADGSVMASMRQTATGVCASAVRVQCRQLCLWQTEPRDARASVFVSAATTIVWNMLYIKGPHRQEPRRSAPSATAPSPRVIE